MKVLPVNLLIEGKLAVVVGAGKVAARKAAALLAAGARVRVVGKEFAPEFDTLEGVETIRAAYRRNHIDGAWVVIAATDSGKINSQVARDARKAGALVNVVDTPELCDFVFPAVVQKGEVAIAVSTGGASPTLAKRLKDQISSSIDDAYEGLAKVLAAVRSRAIKAIPDPARRREFFETLADDKFLAMLKKDGYDKALAKAQKLLEDHYAVKGRRVRRDA
jgi:siroheme synthase-like protein